jgi:hypothetical protein
MKTVARSTVASIATLAVVIVVLSAAVASADNLACGTVQTNNNVWPPICPDSPPDGPGAPICSLTVVWPAPTDCLFAPNNNCQYCSDKNSYGQGCTVRGTLTRWQGYCDDGVCILDMENPWIQGFDVPYICSSGQDCEICPEQ